jgi:hypothetical protein
MNYQVQRLDGKKKSAYQKTEHSLRRTVSIGIRKEREMEKAKMKRKNIKCNDGSSLSRHSLGERKENNVNTQRTFNVKVRLGRIIINHMHFYE